VEAELAVLAAEAERGYDPDHISTRAPGRPRMGAAPAVVLPIRLHADLHVAVKRRAAVERTSVSELVRHAALQYLETEVAQPPEAVIAADVSSFAAEAEAGYDVGTIRMQQRPRGRAEVVPIRVPPELKERLEARANTERTSVSEIVRAALRALLRDPELDPPPHC
jgi:Arc/MetJ-type ribon-helix-helix transcriptional regulator